MSKMDVLVIAGIVALVAFVCFTMGLLVRRAADQDLIQELEAELDARQPVMPPEIAHEPVTVGRVVETVNEVLVSFQAMGMMPSEAAATTWDLPAITERTGFIALPDWHAPLEGNDLEEHIAVMGAELQEYVAALIAASNEAA